MVAWLRIAGWASVIVVIRIPWRGLGGVLDEHSRWQERWATFGLMWVGAWLAHGLPELSIGALYRRLVWPALVGAFLVVVAAALAGRPELVLLSVNGLIGYVAGVDVAAVAARARRSADRRGPERP